MTTIIISSLIFLVGISQGFAQKRNKADSLTLKADIENISQGREVKNNKRGSIVRSPAIRAKVDTAALKPAITSPTPASPNNPNPYQPVPNVVNAEPPATPSAHPIAPAGAPAVTEERKKKKQ